MRDYQLEDLDTGQRWPIAAAPTSIIQTALQVGSVPMDTTAPPTDAFEDRLRLELEIRALGLRSTG